MTRRSALIGGLLGILGLLAQPGLANAAPPDPSVLVLHLYGTYYGQATITDLYAPITPSVPDVAQPYPSVTAATAAGLNFVAHPVPFAGLLPMKTVPGGVSLNAYCINARLDSDDGYGYTPVTITAAQNPDIAYVYWIVANQHAANTPPNPAQLGIKSRPQAAAIQLAIWYFTDGFVIDTSDPLYAATRAIVQAAIAAGGQSAPADPLTLSPSVSTTQNPALAGPFTVSSNIAGTPLTVTANGAQMYSAAQATMPIADGATVLSGSTVYLKATASGASTATLFVHGLGAVGAAQAYEYDQNVAGVAEGQGVILDTSAQVGSSAQATVQFTAAPATSTSSSDPPPGEGAAAGAGGLANTGASISALLLISLLLLVSGTAAQITASRNFGRARRAPTAIQTQLPNDPSPS